jgi:hypothetical protein
MELGLSGSPAGMLQQIDIPMRDQPSVLGRTRGWPALAQLNGPKSSAQDGPSRPAPSGLLASPRPRVYAPAFKYRAHAYRALGDEAKAASDEKRAQELKK